MSLPTPPVAFNGQCTVIYNNTLYAFQSTAFQALPLAEGAEWAELAMGTPITGAQCVSAQWDGQDALVVVGGTTNQTSLQSYSGLQWYIYADRQWQSSPPMVSVTQNRQMHGATYLNSSSSILIYAGFQDDSYMDSSQTFTISTIEPHTMQAYPSSAPPVMQPILVPWNQSHAALIGGSPDNDEVWTFSEADGWQQANVTLPTYLPSINEVQGTIIDIDGNKLLQLFNMSASPNSVVTYLVDAASNTSLSSRDLNILPSHRSLWKKPRRSRRRQRRDMGQSDYPPYNGTLAPTAVRDGFSLAQDSTGLVVIAGGVNLNSDDSLCVFNQTNNAWINANSFFDIPSSTPVTPTPTGSSAASSSSAAAAAAANQKSQSLTIVGAVLGAVFGFAALCIVALVLLRCIRQRRRKNDYPSESKDQMDSADRGGEFMTPRGGSFTQFLPQNTTSVAATGGKTQSKRGLFHKAGDSSGSARSMFGRNRSPVIPALITDAPLAVTSPERPTTANMLSPEVTRTWPRTDEGWSTYFNNNNYPTDLTRLEPGSTRYEISRSGTASQSEYTGDSRVASSQPHHSAEVPPLNLRSSHVPSENTWEQSQNLHPAQQTGLSFARGRDHDPISTSTFSQIPEEEMMEESSSGQDSWTPVATSDKGSAFEQRASSIYADSAIYPHPGQRVRIPNFPTVPTSNRTSQTTVIPVDEYIPINRERGMRTMASKDFAGGLAQPERQPPDNNARAGPSRKGLRTMASKDFAGGLAKPERHSPDGGAKAGPSTEGHGPRPVPRPAGDAHGAYRGLRKEEDMSWLNLGPK